MELLSFVAMEPPVSFQADAVRAAEKVKVVEGDYANSSGGHGSRPVWPRHRGWQGVPGYRQEDRVHPRSQTETYAALRLEIENWRWAGVPFYIRAGKRLATRVTEITIQFKQPPMRLFKGGECHDSDAIKPNLISMRIQPDEGISLRFGAKLPGPSMDIAPGADELQLCGCVRQVFGERLRAPAAGCDAGRRHAVRSPRWRRGDVGSDDPRS